MFFLVFSPKGPFTTFVLNGLKIRYDHFPASLQCSKMYLDTLTFYSLISFNVFEVTSEMTKNDICYKEGYF